MYIWVILATFMVAIYSFNLSVREDMKDIYATAKIEPTVTKLIAQHEAAERYADANLKVEDGVRTVSYVPGELTYEDVKAFMPYGFKDYMTDGTYRSIIYCLDKDDKTASELPVGCNSGNPVSCCGNDRAQVYLISFGCVPQKFRNPYTKELSTDFLKVLRTSSNYGLNIGYTAYLSDEEKASKDNNFDSDMGIKTKVFDVISVPNYIIKEKQFNSTVSFSEYCGDLRTGEEGELNENSCNACLAYMTRLSN
ncbi:MAG: hypothetical protein PHE89_03085 [Alphaproteobacteria bacterium]|nr:hypothetical protein [Alphaproteobacteria bacterium]